MLPCCGILQLSYPLFYERAHGFNLNHCISTHTQSATQPELPHQPTVPNKLSLYDKPSVFLWELVVSHIVSHWSVFVQ